MREVSLRLSRYGDQVRTVHAVYTLDEIPFTKPGWYGDPHCEVALQGAWIAYGESTRWALQSSTVVVIDKTTGMVRVVSVLRMTRVDRSSLLRHTTRGQRTPNEQESTRWMGQQSVELRPLELRACREPSMKPAPIWPPRRKSAKRKAFGHPVASSLQRRLSAAGFGNGDRITKVTLPPVESSPNSTPPKR